MRVQHVHSDAIWQQARQAHLWLKVISKQTACHIPAERAAAPNAGCLAASPWSTLAGACTCCKAQRHPERMRHRQHTRPSSGPRISHTSFNSALPGSVCLTKRARPSCPSTLADGLGQALARRCRAGPEQAARAGALGAAVACRAACIGVTRSRTCCGVCCRSAVRRSHSWPCTARPRRGRCGPFSVRVGVPGPAVDVVVCSLTHQLPPCTKLEALTHALACLLAG